MKRQFDDSALNLPGQRLPLELLRAQHSSVLTPSEGVIPQPGAMQPGDRSSAARFLGLGASWLPRVCKTAALGMTPKNLNGATETAIFSLYTFALHARLPPIHTLDLRLKLAAIRSRFNLPFAVSIPFSMENASCRRWNARTCL